jgi:hypothetical protein
MSLTALSSRLKRALNKCLPAAGRAKLGDRLAEMEEYGVLAHSYDEGHAAKAYTADDLPIAPVVRITLTEANAAADLILPALTNKVYIIYNNSGQTITVKVAEQTGVELANAGKYICWSDGEDIVTSVPEVTLAGEQTLTNKTMTSPTLNTPHVNEAVALTATSTELNLLDGSVAGTAVASKALALGANKNVDVLAVADLKLGAGAGTSVTATAAQLNEAGAKAATTPRLLNLGAPDLADADLIVTSTNMKNGEYTIATQPDIPRNVTVSATAADTADTMGTITFVGTNVDDEEISEEIAPVAGSVVAGTKAFKSITSITGAGWAIDAVEETNDTITIGTGNELGLPLVLDAATEIVFGILGTTITAHNPTVANPATVEETTVDMSAGTYDGSKAALVFVVD